MITEELKAEEYPDFKFVQEVLAQIPWEHNIILLDEIENHQNNEENK